LLLQVASPGKSARVGKLKHLDENNYGYDDNYDEKNVHVALLWAAS
jgi:hypothetical protein